MTSVDQLTTAVNCDPIPSENSTSNKSSPRLARPHDVTPSEQSTQADSQGLKEKAKKVSKKGKKRKHQIILNISDTKYEVVRHVGKKLFQWRLSDDPHGEWDVFWTDCAVNPETLSKMQPYQKINHFPGMYSLARKNHLGKHLMRMRKAFPNEYKFFPKTYLLPAEYNEFKAQFAGNKVSTYIVKPEASCQGRGIFLTRNGEGIQPGEHYVVQKYLTKPFLIEGLKFDLRIYALLAGCDPLRIYVYNDGLARFATESYVQPTGKNLDNMCMHLTNYAINKGNPNFIFNTSEQNDGEGHKRSLKALFKTLEELGHDVATLWKEIKQLITKTFISVQPILAHNYRSCQGDDPYNNMCFEILGFDILLDHNLKPILLEVNHTPSFTTDTPLDRTIKKNVIGDALRLMNISVENKIKYKKKKRIELRKRILTGKTVKISSEERRAEIERAQRERDEWELQNLGGYERVFPFVDPTQAEEDYGRFLNEAIGWWEEWTGTANKRFAKKLVVDTSKPPPMNFSVATPTNNNNNNNNSSVKLTKNPSNPLKTTTPNPTTALPVKTLPRRVNSAKPSKHDIFIRPSSRMTEEVEEGIKEVNRSLNIAPQWGENDGVTTIQWQQQDKEVFNPLVDEYKDKDKEEKKSRYRGSSCDHYTIEAATKNYNSIVEEDSEDLDTELIGEDDDPDEENEKQIRKIIQAKNKEGIKIFEREALDHHMDVLVQQDLEEAGARTIEAKQNELMRKGPVKVKATTPSALRDQNNYKLVSSGVYQSTGSTQGKAYERVLTSIGDLTVSQESQSQPFKRSNNNYATHSIVRPERSSNYTGSKPGTADILKKETSIVDELLQLSQRNSSYYSSYPQSWRNEDNNKNKFSELAAASSTKLFPGGGKQKIAIRTPRAQATAAVVQKHMTNFGNYVASKVIKVNSVEANETKNDIILSMGIQGFRNFKNNKAENGPKEPSKSISVGGIHQKEKNTVTVRLPPTSFLSRRK